MLETLFRARIPLALRPTAPKSADAAVSATLETVAFNNDALFARTETSRPALMSPLTIRAVTLLPSPEEPRPRSKRASRPISARFVPFTPIRLSAADRPTAAPVPPAMVVEALLRESSRESLTAETRISEVAPLAATSAPLISAVTSPRISLAESVPPSASV
ncbi:hypothetical protein LP7551_04935 [Roseibium album]|nr:hypothetical protein LP7551_04935 [Roseibium album]